MLTILLGILNTVSSSIIHLLFPSYTQIYTRRTPDDTGSLYTTLFGSSARNHTKLEVKASVVVVRFISDEEITPIGFLANYYMESVLSGQY